MRIYCNKNSGELLTEGEVHKEIDNIINDRRFQVLFEKFSDSEIWDMLKEEVKTDLYVQIKEEILKKDYYYRVFDK